MRFACIQDCSVCPLACYRGGGAVQVGQNVQSSSPLPDVLQKTMEVEEQKKSEDLIVPEENTEVSIQENQSLPVLSEVQYEIKDVTPKKGILGLFKKR